MTEQQSDDPVTLYVTVPSKEEGIRIGHVLVKESLAACANVMDNVTSVFAWQGETQEASEAILFAKTRAGLVEDAIATINKEHEYDCPCVVALPIIGGNADFIDWIKSETQP